LDSFQRNNPPSFNGGYNPDGAQNWIREIEKNFRVMACPKGQKVAFGTYTLVEEVEYWWENTRQCLEAEGQDVTWDVFKKVFLEKYFPEDVRNKKEMEFLELKQGNMTVAEYVAKKEHIQRNCPYPKKEKNGGGLNDQTRHPKATGRVFTLNGAEASKSKDLIQGRCSINGISLLVLFDSSTTHSFISCLCVGKLKLSVSSLNKDMVVETLTSGFVLTSDVCLNYPMEISGRTFLIDLICFPLSQIDVILGMDWLSSNLVLLKCFDKSVVFDDSRVSKDMMLISANQVVTSLKEDAQVYMILSSLEVETKVFMCDLPVVREFPEVFPEDISSLPPEKEIEFSIDLVPSAGPIFVAPYRMSPIELAELKK